MCHAHSNNATGSKILLLNKSPVLSTSTSCYHLTWKENLNLEAGLVFLFVFSGTSVIALTHDSLFLKGNPYTINAKRQLQNVICDFGSASLRRRRSTPRGGGLPYESDGDARRLS